MRGGGGGGVGERGGRGLVTEAERERGRERQRASHTPGRETGGWNHAVSVPHGSYPVSGLESDSKLYNNIRNWIRIQNINWSVRLKSECTREMYTEMLVLVRSPP